MDSYFESISFSKSHIKALLSPIDFSYPPRMSMNCRINYVPTFEKKFRYWWSFDLLITMKLHPALSLLFNLRLPRLREIVNLSSALLDKRWAFDTNQKYRTRWVDDFSKSHIKAVLEPYLNICMEKSVFEVYLPEQAGQFYLSIRQGPCQRFRQGSSTWASWSQGRCESRTRTAGQGSVQETEVCNLTWCL